MLVPILVLSISVVVGWVLFDYQSLLPLSEVLRSLNFVTIGASLIALAIGASIAYLAFQSRIQATQKIVQQSSLIQRLRASLLEGLGFDRFYDFLWRRTVLPLSRIASSLQTGLLGVNSALMLLALLVLLFLLVLRVL